MGKAHKTMESIITDRMDECFVCHRPAEEIHHIIFGTANRDLSDKFGLVIPLCAYHHRIGPYAAHKNKAANEYLKALAQRRFKEVWKDYDFVQVFGKDYSNE